LNLIAGWIVFGLGIVFILTGGGLMIYGAVQKRAGAGATEDTGLWASIARLFDPLAKAIGSSIAASVGVVLVVIGLVLVFLPFYLPAVHA
jgi:hypothetical protein